MGRALQPSCAASLNAEMISQHLIWLFFCVCTMTDEGLIPNATEHG